MQIWWWHSCPTAVEGSALRSVLPFLFLLPSYKFFNGRLHIPPVSRRQEAPSGVGQWVVLSATKGNYFPFESLKPR